MTFTATRTENSNGTWKYEINGETLIESGKVKYAAVTIWHWDGMDESEWYPKTHKTEAAALKASGYAGSSKRATIIF